MEKKLVLDFTQSSEVEEIAIMPASLAQRLLKDYANHLALATTKEIVGRFLDDVRNASGESLEFAVATAKSWVQERELIDNIVNNNWDAYKVSQEENIA